MPAAQRRSVLGQVLPGPGHPGVVHLAGDVVVRTEDVEVALAHALEHEIDDLLRRPGSRRLLRHPPGRYAGEGEAGDQQVGGDLAVRGIAQGVGEALGEDFDPGFGDVVGGVARRRGDALLGPGVDDRRGSALVDHRLGEGLDAVQHPEQIGLDPPPPAVGVLEGMAGAAHAGVVHQDGDVAKGGESGVAQAFNLPGVGDIGRHRLDLRSSFGRLGDSGGGFVQRRGWQIGDDHVHPQASQADSRSETNTARAAGDYCGAAGGDGGVRGHGWTAGRVPVNSTATGPVISTWSSSLRHSIFKSPPSNSTVAARSVKPRRWQATKAAQAPVPQALVRPAPRSHTRRRMRSLALTWAKPTLTRSGNSRWCSIIGPTWRTGATSASGKKNTTWGLPIETQPGVCITGSSIGPT